MSVGRISGVRRYETATCPGSLAAIAGKKCVPRSLDTLYGAPALPGISPPPPSHVVPPSFDHTTYMSYSQAVSDCTVPAADFAEHRTGFEFRLMANPK